MVRVNHLLFLVLLLLAVPAAQAQTSQPYLAGQRQPTTITFVPTYQQFDQFGDRDGQVAEVSLPLFVYLPVRRNVGVSVQLSQASVTADDAPSLGGLTDVQLAASYFRAVGSGSVVFGLGLNLPSGAQAFTLDELDTAFLLSQNVYSFRVPSFGRGLGLAPSITWAQPLSPSFVVGLGATFQYRGPYEPLADMLDSYDPGDEILLTGGFDARLAPGITLAADIAVTLYGSDAVGDEDIFAAGTRTVITAQFRRRWGQGVAGLLARYRASGKNRFLDGGSLITEAERTTPTHVDVRGHARHRVHPSIEAGVVGVLRLFEETPVFPSTSLFGTGVTSTFLLSSRVRLPVRFTYYFGDLAGLEASAGLVLRL